MLKTKRIVMHPNVEKFILKGANLMWPGVCNKDDLEEFEADDIIDIYTNDNKFIAVGAYGCNSTELEPDMKGIAAYILCIVNDFLWKMGDQVVLEPIEKP